MSTARFAISTDPVGFGEVTVNGEDVTDRVQGFRIESVQGQPSVLTLYSSAAGAIEGEGIVQVESLTGDDGEVIATFLANLDPKLVEQKALDRTGWGDATLTSSIFEILTEIARGKP